VANLVMVGLSASGVGACPVSGGRVGIYNSQGTTSVIADTFGFFT